MSRLGLQNPIIHFNISYYSIFLQINYPISLSIYLISSKYTSFPRIISLNNASEYEQTVLTNSMGKTRLQRAAESPLKTNRNSILPSETLFLSPSTSPAPELDHGVTPNIR